MVSLSSSPCPGRQSPVYTTSTRRYHPRVMETTLHRQLKEFYCSQVMAREVRVGEYRIDAVVDGRLIEIQHASLGALKHKVPALLRQHSVVVVKPLAAHKTILRRDRKNGPVVSRRTSPRHERLLDLFQDLVHFIGVFPHPRLTIEVLLTEQEEHRLRKSRRKRWCKDYCVDDRCLIAINSRHVLQTAADLADLLPPVLPDPFTTADLAAAAQIPRWLAQKMAYCLKQCGGVTCTGKRGNAWLYCRTGDIRSAA
ncbi:MAG: hypothetical protein EXS05_04035 [Planctomycetaceae bacterium]|nr:hypothetical protein [Planctomycetaceae bacterium]